MVNAYLDTGASATLIAHTVLKSNDMKKLRKYKGTVSDASGNKIPILGAALAQVLTPEGEFPAYVLVYEKKDTVGHDMLIGMNILRHTTIDFGSKELKFSIPKTRTRISTTNNGLRLKISDMKISEAVTSGTTQVANVDERESTAQSASTTQHEAKTEEQHTEPKSPELSVYLRSDIVLKNNSVMFTTVPINKQITNGRELILHSNCIQESIYLANVITVVDKNHIQVNLINVSEEDVTLTKGTRICTAEYLDDEKTVEKINLASNVTTTKPSADENSYRPLSHEDIVCDDPKYTEAVLKELNRYRNACWLPGEPLGKYTGDQLEIRLKENRVINNPPYRVPYAFQKKLDEYIAKLLAEGTITLSKSSYNSPLIIVKRADGEIRPCIDYRALNQVMETVSFPLPRISDLLNSLGQATFITSLDLASAYHQCLIRECDREKTAFTVKNTKFEFTRVPFGLQSSPAFFARIINEILFDVLGPQCLAYMDDLVLFSATAEQHLETLRRVLHRLSVANIKLKVNKCRFFATEIKFLGYQVSSEGMTMNKERVTAIMNIGQPTSKRQLQAFLGVVNYFRVFVHRFAIIAEPLYSLLRKNVPFVWTSEHTDAMETLKKILANAPIVRFPDFNRTFHIHTDASNVGIAAVLMQEYGNRLHPIAYYSKTLNNAQRAYSASKKEALALVSSLEHFRHIILTYDVEVYTDHKPLIGIFKNPTKDECLKRWSVTVQEYAIKIHYLEGKNNIFSDALSRLPSTTNSAEDIDKELQDTLDERICPYDKEKILQVVINNVLSDDILLEGNPNMMHDYIPIKWPWDEAQLKSAQKKDSYCTTLVKQLNNKETSGETIPANLLLNCKVLKGLLYVVRKIKRSSLIDEFLVPYIPDNLMPDAFRVLHSDNTAGHKGPERTLKLFIRNFYNVLERKLIYQYCSDCELCIKAKGLPKKVPMLKFPVPLRPFDTITSDVLGPLRLTERNKRFILTVRDYTTRYTVLFAMEYKDSDTIIDALRQVISHYGSSRVMVSDNAPEYQSDKLLRFLHHYNTRKVSIAPYHPASQGLSERVNLEVTKLLRIFTEQYAINDWDSLLPVIQLAINNTFNASISETPFYALFSFDSGTVTLSPPRLHYGEDDLTQHLQKVAKVRQHCRERLLMSQAAYTDYFNAGRRTKDIEIGQRVYAKISKHRLKPKKKLDMPVSGPFKVMGRKGKAWILKELATEKQYVVHPDYILQSAAQRKHPQAELQVPTKVDDKTTGQRREDSDDDSVAIGPQRGQTSNTSINLYTSSNPVAVTTTEKQLTRVPPPHSSTSTNTHPTV